MLNAKETLRLQRWIVLVAVLLFILKIVAWWLTRSVAILTDALESIVNVIAGFVGLYSLSIASLPSDENHPYGHGKAEFLSAAIEGTLIMLAGLFIIYEAIRNLIDPHPIQKLDVGIALVAFSAVVNYALGQLAVKRGKANQSEALEASGHHLKTDTYSTLAIIAGLILIFFTGIRELDSIIALIMSIVVMVIGYRIARKSVAGIMDEADDAILEQIISLLNGRRSENWIDIHNLRVIKFGNILHIDCHMTVPWYFNVREAHVEVDSLRKLVEEKFGPAVEFFVHEDDCLPESCPVCIKTDCKVRQQAFQRRIEWNLANVVPNHKHELSTP